MMSDSASSYAMEMAGTMSVPKSIQRMVTVPKGKGISAKMKSKNGERYKEASKQSSQSSDATVPGLEEEIGGRGVRSMEVSAP